MLMGRCPPPIMRCRGKLTQEPTFNLGRDTSLLLHSLATGTCRPRVIPCKTHSLATGTCRPRVIPCKTHSQHPAMCPDSAMARRMHKVVTAQFRVNYMVLRVYQLTGC